MSLAKPAGRIIKLSKRVLDAAMAMSVLVAVVAVLLTSPGVLLDYNNDSYYLPRLVNDPINSVADFASNFLSIANLKRWVVFALVMGAWSVGLDVLLRGIIKSATLQG